MQYIVKPQFELFIKLNNGYWREIHKRDNCIITLKDRVIEATVLDIHEDEIEIVDKAQRKCCYIELDLIKEIKIIEA